MTSVICFSKDRPMQLHAYLESLLLYSDFKESDISVLYVENPKISYDRVKESFPNVNWVIESDFRTQLWKLIQDSPDYIMFGCDDVVFVDYFSVVSITKFLDQNELIFGFQVRLGNNFIEQPINKEIKGGNMIWNWKEKNEGYFYYPWELDCSVYRKTDVIELVGKYLQEMINPNYLESIIDTKGRNDIKRPLLACANSRIKAICITVNRVQDTHLNDFDQSTNTDIFTLSNIYNQNDNKLDIQRISKKTTNHIHVGAEYFILEKTEKQIKPNNKKSFRWRIWMLLRNINYLSTVNLREEQWYSSRAIANKIKDEIKAEYNLEKRK